MFVPVDVLKPMLGDLLTDGHRTGPSRPWLGIYAREIGGHVLVADVAEDGPAAKAGVEAGDLIVGVGATPIHGLADFYRRVWATGAAGVSVPLMLYKPGGATAILPVPSIDRLHWLKLDSSL